MDISDAERIKHREIAFQDLHPDLDQTRAAARLLAGIEGILTATPLSPTSVTVSYDVLRTTLKEIESALIDTGLHLDSSLIHRLRRALYYYTEETLRANLGHLPDDITSPQRLFAKRYELMMHGCRDERPDHWRRYL
jgi:hypothetical protein